jgi:B-box zinc finger
MVIQLMQTLLAAGSMAVVQFLESVSNVCFGAVQPAMDQHTVLEDIAHNIVDEASARRVYEKYDDKTGLLVTCRRSDRMIDESMNRHDFDATPVLLHCGHTVCRGCAYRCVRAHENAKQDTMFAMVECPVRCNRQTAFVCDLGVEWLPIDIRRIRLLQEQKDQLPKQPQQAMCCEHKDRVATVRCTHVSCAEFPLMCAECDKAEHSGRNSSKHVRVSPSQVSASASRASPSDSICSAHQLPLTGVCMGDGAPVCGECLYDHVGHEVKRLHEVCSDWSTKLETLQRETLIRAHILSGRAASVQQQCDDMMSDIMTHFDSVVHCANTRRNQLAFEVRRWRKMQLEESKMLAAESSQVSASAMYERMLLQRALMVCDESKSLKQNRKNSKQAHAGKRKPGKRSSSVQSASAAATCSSSASSSVATLAERVPDAVLGSVAGNVHARGSAIESQSVELTNGIAAMQAEDLSVVFDNATHASVLDRIRSMGGVNVRATNIWTQGLSQLQSCDGDQSSSPSSRNSTKRKAASELSIGNGSSSAQQEESQSQEVSASPNHKRRRRQSDTTA